MLSVDELNDTNFTNVAIVTFLPPDLSRGRYLDADIDLYVSTNPALTNLDETVISGAQKSLRRGGTEFVIYSNSFEGATYYIGVKSEDQQGAEFGIFAVSSLLPFGGKDKEGNAATFSGFATYVFERQTDNSLKLLLQTWN